MEICFTSITVNTPNLEEMLRFYQILGCNFQQAGIEKGGKLYRSHIRGIEFCLLSTKTFRRDRHPQVMITFKLPSLDEKIQSLTAVSGVLVVLDPMDTPDGRRALLQDPDGNSIELLS